MTVDPLREKVLAPISDTELERRWKAVRQVMDDRGIDYIVAQNNNDYLGGYVKWFTDFPAVHAYPAAVVFARDGEMTTITHGSSDPTKAGPAPWLARGATKRISTPIMLSLNYTCDYDGRKVVEELAPKKGCVIGLVNEGGMTAAFSHTIRTHLTSAHFVDVTEEIDWLKAIKSPEEIERIKYSAYIHDVSWEACLAAIAPGVHEFELAAEAKYAARKLGTEQVFVLIGSAPKGKAFPYNSIHAMNRKLEKGDQVGVLIELNDAAGYWCHIHRIACVGDVSDELAKAFQDAKDAQDYSLGLVKPGADPVEILNANNQFLRDRGYPEETRIYAHGQGYDLVERPSFQPGETMKIAAGMNIAVHPAAATPQATALLCDNYIVTETGVGESLYRTPREIFVV
ncbi:MAG: M24 family metallopeptidase [Rhodospirillales bacterium]|jgi:Xaa-Pro aminopeptidase|nr:M24 family metallopeptidase [Rhodospirillales bacterium]